MKNLLITLAAVGLSTATAIRADDRIVVESETPNTYGAKSSNYLLHMILKDTKTDKEYLIIYTAPASGAPQNFQVVPLQ